MTNYDNGMILRGAQVVAEVDTVPIVFTFTSSIDYWGEYEETMEWEPV